jgi:superfamily II DNA or RNA helicase
MIERENLPINVSNRLKELHDDQHKDLSLYLWQEGAVQAWAGVGIVKDPRTGESLPNDREFYGIISAVTGAGKTVTAIECIWVWLQDNPTGRVTILVPTRGLQRQWRGDMVRAFPNMRIGMLGGGRADFQQISIATMNTAAKGLPEVDGPHLIVVDECHNIGSEFRQYAIRNNAHTAVLGLSATPAREDSGLTVVSHLCGPIVYDYKFDEALSDGVIIPFTVRAVSVPLSRSEQSEYDELTNQIRRVSFVLRRRYGSTNWFTMRVDPSDPDMALVTFKDLCMTRKRLVNEAHFRFEVIDDILRLHENSKTMIFHERIKQLEWMNTKYEGITPETIPNCDHTWEQVAMTPPDCSEWIGMNPEIYHGKRPKGENDKALDRFANGDSQLLLSCKALREGIDVPSCDLGIMVSGTNSARARVQTLGRCLRRGDKTEAVVYLLFVPDTTDQKGIVNLKYGGKLPDGTIEWWRYHPSSGLRKVGQEEKPELPKRKPKVEKPKHICDKCHKLLRQEGALHHCQPRLTKTGRRSINLWGDMIGKRK